MLQPINFLELKIMTWNGHWMDLYSVICNTEQVRSRVRLFADATALYLAISSLSDANILQDDLSKLKQ